MQPRVLVVLVATVATLTACTANGSGAPSAGRRTRTVVESPSTSPIGTPTPVDEGATRSATGHCPLVTKHDVHYTLGMRLGRVTVQRVPGRVVGCRFYALQGGPLHRSEHLPGPHQPALEITTSRYRSAAEAHNAFVLRARTGSNPTQSDLGGTVGVCFQNHFDPADHGRDWACAVNKADVELVVQAVANHGPRVNNTGPLDTIDVTRKIFGALPS